MRPVEEVSSILEMRDIYVKSCKFERKSNEITDYELQIGVERTTRLDNDSGEFSVTLAVTVTNKSDEFNVMVECVGVFFISDGGMEDRSLGEALIKRNTVAIMFPYVRTQITLLTSSPNMQPVVLPAINISELLEQE